MAVVRVVGRALGTDPRAIWRAIRSEALDSPRPLRAWYALLGVLLLFGAVGAVRALVPGDKGIGTTPTVEWGLLIVAYVFFAVTTSGLCLASSLGTVFGIDRFRPLEKRHAVLAVTCLVTAFGVIALDLHYPIRLVFGAAFNPSPSSPMWWMGVFYGIYLCFLLVEVWSIFWHHPSVHQVACLLASAMAILAPSTLGAVFGVLASRPYWAGVFTPLLMLSSAFLSGTALLGIVFSAVERFRLTGFERAAVPAFGALRVLIRIALVLVACLVGRQLVVGLLSDDAGLRSATRSLLDGPLAVQFVGVRIVGGLLAPFVILALPGIRPGRALFVAGCLALVGVFADRLSFVSAGQIAPATAVSGVVSSPYAAYSPSPVEISIVVGAIAFVALVYTLAERYLDLSESEEHVAISIPIGWLATLPVLGRRAPGDVRHHGVLGSEAGAVRSAAGPDAQQVADRAVAPAGADASQVADGQVDLAQMATAGAADASVIEFEGDAAGEEPAVALEADAHDQPDSEPQVEPEGEVDEAPEADDASMVDDSPEADDVSAADDVSMVEPEVELHLPTPAEPGVLGERDDQ
ncbi:MAG TPA: NrfD/PsrC family molybdoenzyme membrane anchor subunit [Candidatus Limnocylindrales bacterium]